MEDYQIATIAMVREVDSMLNLKRDESIAHMYRQWSQMIAAAGWLTPSKAAVADFVKWATTRPCDEYEDAYIAGKGAKGCVDAIRMLCGPNTGFSREPEQDNA